MQLARAQYIVSEIVRYLAPYCDRIAIAGSVRRQVPTVGDLEIVCIPSTSMENTTLFDTEPVRNTEFVRRVEALGTTIRGEATGRWMSIQGKEITLDLFMCTRENWGYIYALRTGSVWFSHKVLAQGWVKKGYRGMDGQLVRVQTGEIVPLYEEHDLFRLIGIPYVQPEQRR